MGAYADIVLPLKRLYSGKVRELFEIDDTRMLLVATDRISAFDHVLRTPIPDKGRVLTRLSVFWFRRLAGAARNHLIETEFEKFPPELRRHEALRDRAVIVRRAARVDIECVVRGYLAGSGWQEYRSTGAVCGVRLPAGLRESDRLPEPIFTPATKEEKGTHDMNITYAEMERRVGVSMAASLRDVSLALYREACACAEARGIIIADTKFEFGLVDGNLILIDELLTPDSSRFWEMERYRPGASQDSLDKQYVRDYLTYLSWDRSSPPPPLPTAVAGRLQSTGRSTAS